MTRHQIRSAESGSQKKLLTVEEARQRLSIGRTYMFQLISSGAIESVKIGRLRRVPTAALNAYVARLSEEQHAA